jgi:hypothetical protein
VSKRVIIITDDSILEYPIGFSVFQKDFGLWLNGTKLIDGIDYTFNQLPNSITLLVPVGIDDVLQLRRFTDK